MSTEKKNPDYLTRPFRVLHANGDVVQGYNDLKSAEESAAERNARAKKMGLTARYAAVTATNTIL